MLYWLLDGLSTAEWYIDCSSEILLDWLDTLGDEGLLARTRYLGDIPTRVMNWRSYHPRTKGSARTENVFASFKIPTWIEAQVSHEYGTYYHSNLQKVSGSLHNAQLSLSLQTFSLAVPQYCVLRIPARRNVCGTSKSTIVIPPSTHSVVFH
jgi:hypothetical protein